MSVTVPNAEYDYGPFYWSTITEDISGYYHPPCVQVTGTEPPNANVRITVRGKRDT